jgi:hypothetical protein
MTLISDTQTYSYKVGKYIRGKWIEKYPEDLTFEGSIQPLNFKDINSLPTGRQDKGRIKAYSDTPLPIAKEIEEVDENEEVDSGAILKWQGCLWEVTAGDPFQMGLIPHYRYIAEYRGIDND